MRSMLVSRRDLDFLLYDWLHVEEPTKRDRFPQQEERSPRTHLRRPPGECHPGGQSGPPEQIGTFVTPMLTGRFSGTMAMSETHAGSSLADISTRAEADVPQLDLLESLDRTTLEMSDSWF